MSEKETFSPYQYFYIPEYDGFRKALENMKDLCHLMKGTGEFSKQYYKDRYTSYQAWQKEKKDRKERQRKEKEESENILKEMIE